MSLYGSSVEYGLHCLLTLVPLSEGPGQPPALPASDLADFQGVSPSLVRKVFTKLERAGLVASAEGKGGGFRLARSASDISVLDVVDAIEGDKPLFDCKQIQGNCAVLSGDVAADAARSMCMIHTVMLEAEQAMRRSLRSYSLAQMSKGMTASMPPRYLHSMESWFNDRLAGRPNAPTLGNRFLPSEEVKTSAKRKRRA
ncbi:RrF2 family transcriptional regulator [Phycisphaera mikurensis]|uniref:Putative Rrf2 family DNA-binding protein n=1 Tax=Phycisphaera mikurensis (strain NBRC 102666 / KCTC 22515 / FYK2301M01) TaxID=1142394 RepID=I0IBS0_PHYMF|nr:Rrf2 family transcriptional regulator [Phycisphaera mikurensis]MBB6442060.1 Rrf2 family protein [Phycisphaera mikurensis]BAM02708.1 putative Rrf2 family DNA-binding protein [Phycisphaera mikurensis NBRC 102666]